MFSVILSGQRPSLSLMLRRAYLRLGTYRNIQPCALRVYLLAPMKALKISVDMSIAAA